MAVNSVIGSQHTQWCLESLFYIMNLIYFMKDVLFRHSLYEKCKIAKAVTTAVNEG
jgi:hypothetical protein